MIPSEFENARFDNYQIESEVQHLLSNTMKAYLKLFKDSFDKKQNRDTGEKPNLGFIAEVGEQRIRSLPSADRSQIKHEKNSFGLGKTHLQVAASKWLMRQGYNTLLVSDISFMDELMQARRMDDGYEMLNKLLDKALNVNVLIWDDIGKSKPSEAKEGMYYKIINERYRANRPIVFSSNEDRGTLAERIGYAAASRLLGNCFEDHLIECVGQDWRLRKEKV
ncbi:DNA replication protein DnaC [Salibacterium halotolerans]|uniref:DNA replication protein DnaC n=2 Tax=Salibacterium halotolerans TaxID=1884432 RepID=A0A1I5N865_9BACI|nr:DNA replication protein DnaC [Salibacterium halotolerans]